jgi:DNA-binding MarR family transcriptional regulator
MSIPFEKFKADWVLQLAADAKELTATTYAVALVISNHMNRDDRDRAAWPGHTRIMRLTGLSRSTVKRAVKLLEKRGHVEVERTFKFGRRRNYYLPRVHGMTLRQGSAGEPLLLKGPLREPLMQLTLHLRRKRRGCPRKKGKKEKPRKPLFSGRPLLLIKKRSPSR